MKPDVSRISRRISRIGASATMQVWLEAERLRAVGADVIDLGAGEPDFPTPANIKQAAVTALDGDFTKYTAASGTPELKKAICARHAADFGTAYRTDECIVTVGGKHAIFGFIQALVDPGDEVIIPTPCWMTFRDAAQYAGGVCVFADTAKNGFVFTAEMLEAAITEKTKMAIVNSPSNPTGAAIGRDEFAAIVRVARAHGIYVLADECYIRILYDGEPFSAAALTDAKETVLVAGSLSKTYAMTGWRIGYGLSPAPVIAAMTKLQSHSTSNPTSIAQKAAVEALNGPQDGARAMLDEYRKRRDFIVPRLRSIPGVTCGLPQGAFYAYPNVSAALGKSIGDATEFARRLIAETGVVVVPGEGFGSSGHIRISFAASMRDLERGMDRLHEFIVKYS